MEYGAENLTEGTKMSGCQSGRGGTVGMLIYPIPHVFDLKLNSLYSRGGAMAGF